jgi:hypothetical protein
VGLIPRQFSERPSIIFFSTAGNFGKREAESSRGFRFRHKFLPPPLMKYKNGGIPYSGTFWHPPSAEKCHPERGM